MSPRLDLFPPFDYLDFGSSLPSLPSSLPPFLLPFPSFSVFFSYEMAWSRPWIAFTWWSSWFCLPTVVSQACTLRPGLIPRPLRGEFYLICMYLIFLVFGKVSLCMQSKLALNIRPSRLCLAFWVLGLKSWHVPPCQLRLFLKSSFEGLWTLSAKSVSEVKPGSLFKSS